MDLLTRFCKTCSNMYRLGWDERNGGNISYLLSKDEVIGHLGKVSSVADARTLPLGFDASVLAGEGFLVTASGSYFKNIQDDPETNLGIVQVSDDGKNIHILWGFKGDGRPTSEFPAHLLSHIERRKINPKNKVILHCHPTHTLAMNFVHELESKSFTHSLWQMCTECIVVFPDGIGVLPWMLCGTTEIGKATADMMREFRLVVWGMHGIYGAGETLDEAFGLVETVEKAAQLYLLTAHLPRVNTITDKQLVETATAFRVNYRKDFLGGKK